MNIYPMNETINSLKVLLGEINRLGEEAIQCYANDDIDGMFDSLEARDSLCAQMKAEDVEHCRSVGLSDHTDLKASATQIMESIAALLAQNGQLIRLVTLRRDQTAEQIRVLQQANHAQRSAAVRWSDVGGHIIDQTR